MRLYDESARRSRECGDEHYALRATRSLSWAYQELGDLESARTVAEDNLRQARATDDEYIQGVTLSQLARYAVAGGRLEDAASMLTDSYRILRDLNESSLDRSRCRWLRQRPRPRGKSGDRHPRSLLLGSSPGGDRREAPVAHEDEREDARRHPHAARPTRLRRSLGARPGADRRRGRRACPRRPRLNTTAWALPWARPGPWCGQRTPASWLSRRRPRLVHGGGDQESRLGGRRQMQETESACTRVVSELQRAAPKCTVRRQSRTPTVHPAAPPGLSAAPPAAPEAISSRTAPFPSPLARSSSPTASRSRFAPSARRFISAQPGAARWACGTRRSGSSARRPLRVRVQARPASA